MISSGSTLCNAQSGLSKHLNLFEQPIQTAKQPMFGRVCLVLQVAKRIG